MRCPKCRHELLSSTTVNCANCGEVFERQMLDDLGRMRFLVEWLEAREEELSTPTLEALLKSARDERRAVRERYGLAAPPAPAQSAAASPKPVAATESLEPADSPGAAVKEPPGDSDLQPVVESVAHTPSLSKT